MEQQVGPLRDLPITKGNPERPETKNPNESDWNGTLITFGTGIFVVLAALMALWFLLSKFW